MIYCLAFMTALDPASVPQEAVRQRTAGFADGSAPSMHRARVTLPARVAALLAAEPQLVAPAVEAFYVRDTAAMKARVVCLPGCVPIWSWAVATMSAAIHGIVPCLRRAGMGGYA